MTDSSSPTPSDKPSEPMPTTRDCVRIPADTNQQSWAPAPAIPSRPQTATKLVYLTLGARTNLLIS